MNKTYSDKYGKVKKQPSLGPSKLFSKNNISNEKLMKNYIFKCYYCSSISSYLKVFCQYFYSEKSLDA